MSDKKLALYDLDAQFKDLDALLETSGGDLDQEKDGKTLAEWLEKNEIATKEKVDSYCFIIDRYYGDAAVCKQMIGLLKAREQAHIKKAERLEALLKQSMELRKVEKIPAPMHTVWIQKNGGKPSVVIEKTLEEMPPQYRKVVPEHEEIDTEKLKADAIAGNEDALKLCKVGEVGTSLRIK